MYGLEKKPKHVFEFDLEKDLKKDPNKARELLESTQTKIDHIKTLIRKGSKGPELDQLGVLLHGYNALQKVLNRLANKR
jgi:transcription termination factor NusB